MSHPDQIITGQHVTRVQTELSKGMRRCMPPCERLLWAHLRGNRLQGLHFRRQQIVGCHIVAFYCHAARLAVEVDGPIHVNPAIWGGEHRDQELAAWGLLVLHVTTQQVEQDLPGVLLRIAAACAGRR